MFFEFLNFVKISVNIYKNLSEILLMGHLALLDVYNITYLINTFQTFWKHIYFMHEVSLIDGPVISL